MSGIRETGPIRLEWKYADNFRREYVTNFFGMVGDFDYRVIFGASGVLMQADPNAIPKAQGEYKFEAVMSFWVMKQLRNVLDEAVKNVEMRVGEIKLPRRPEDVFKQP
jgi:hypothetical protein